MQSLTTRASSRVLDFLDIGHVRAGNTIELPGKQLFVAEACSGVHSQLVLVACSAILVVLARRPALRGIILIASAFVWATLVNMVRVTTVAIAAATSDFDLSTGWQHEVLGFGLVGLGLLLVVSTDQFLGMLLAPIDPRSSAAVIAGSQVAASPGTRNPLARLWNRFIACPISDSEVAPQDTDEGDTDDSVAENSRPKWKFRSSSLGGKLFASAFCVIGLLEIGILLSTDSGGLKPEEISIAFDETSLPTEMTDWQRVQFTTEHRDRSSDEGECSQIWRYRAGNSIANVSMDYPFVGWHELTHCYEGRGWHVESREIHSPDARPTSDGTFVEVEMSMPTGERGFLLFSLFDRDGRPVTPGESHGQRLIKKIASNPLARVLGLAETTASPDAIGIQVQQFLQLGDRPTPEEREQAVEKFLQFRDRLRNLWLEQQHGT